MKIELSEQDLSYIGLVLGKQPYAEVAALISRLQQQVQKAAPKESE